MSRKTFQMNFYRRLIASSSYQYFMNNSVLMNWNNLNKSILVLLLGGTAHLLWITWYSSLYHSESFNHWFNPYYHQFHLGRMILFCILSYLFIIPIYLGRHQPFCQKYLPFLAMSFFGFTFIYGGYSVGILSPASIAGYVSIVTVGLVLFERKIVYPILIPITLYLIIAVIMSLHGMMPYAPIYSVEFNQSISHRNEFWMYAQMYFYIPIFFAALVLFEVLLTQWRNREKQVSEMSQIDPLTGIFNRRKIGENLNEMKQQDRSFAIILMDLDHFKMINDTYGHDIGDEVLKRVAKKLASTVRGGDIVGRFGGEEFILVLENKTLKQAIDIAERCRIEIENEVFRLNEFTTLQISASFGITISNAVLPKEAIIKQADEALYLAKKSGRNQVKPFHATSGVG